MAHHRDDAQPLYQSSGQVPEVERIEAVAFYDPHDGVIRHLHQTVTFKGASRATTEMQLERAADAARRLGCDVERLRALHLTDFRPSARPTRVDLEGLELVDDPQTHSAIRHRRSGR